MVLLLVFGLMIPSHVINLFICPSRVNIYAGRVPAMLETGNVCDLFMGVFQWKRPLGAPRRC